MQVPGAPSCEQKHMSEAPAASLASSSLRFAPACPTAQHSAGHPLPCRRTVCRSAEAYSEFQPSESAVSAPNRAKTADHRLDHQTVTCPKSRATAQQCSIAKGTRPDVVMATVGQVVTSMEQSNRTGRPAFLNRLQRAGLDQNPHRPG